jgi:hypothetical protein
MVIMKKVVWLLFFLVVSTGGISAQPDSLWSNANAQYTEGNYAEAIANYTALIDSNGIVNAQLYYNAANAYYKQNEIAKAILYYEKAIKLAPDDEDILYNLQIAQQHTIDKIDAVPVFFAVRWLRAIPQWATADVWGYWSLLAFAGMLVLLLLVLTGISKHRRTLLTLVLLLFIASLTTLWIAATAKNDAHTHTHAIVMLPVSTVKSSPDNGSTDLFILHEGTKVQTLETIGKWAKVRTADGNQGWLPLNSIATI